MSKQLNTNILYKTKLQILDLLVKVMFVLTLPLLVFSLSRIPNMGVLPVMYLHVFLATYIGFLYLGRKKLSFSLQSISIMIVFILIGIGGVVTNLKVASGVPAFLVASIYGSISFDKKFAYSLLALESIFFGLFVHLKSNEINLTQEIMAILTNHLVFGFFLIYAVDKIVRSFAEVIRDLSEREKELERSNEVKSKFLSLMSHEIRTPLNGIILSNQQFKSLSEENKNLSSIIEVSSQALLDMVNDLLDVTKLQSGKLDLVNKPFDLINLVEEICLSYEPQVKQSGVALKVDNSLKDRIFDGDKTRIQQIIRNLLNNSFKFTSSGRITLTIGRSGDEVIFSVEDTGIGISEDRISTVFEEFEQENSEISIQYGGSGLGLNIVKRIAELMSGSVSLESKKNVGTKVSVKVKLPAVESSAEESEKSEAFSLPDLSKLSVLVAEDNPINANLFEKLLREGNPKKISMCANGKEAMELALVESFDLIFMDIRMPVLDGIQATMLIREKSSINAKTPIVGVSANAYKEDMAKSFDAGMDYYLTKPVFKKEFHKLIFKIAKDCGF